MKIVIEIDSEVYSFIKNRGHIPYGVNIANEIANGAVIPNRHGDLIDRDALIQKQFIPNHGFELVDLNDLNTAPIIIPAERGKERKNETN